MRNQTIAVSLAAGLIAVACQDEGQAPAEREGAAKKAATKGEPAQEEPAKSGDPLLNPSAADEEAPAEYTVKLATTKGPIHIDVTRAWAPKGADRFYNLVKSGFYEDVAFFRVIDNFMAQFGISGRPEVAKAWRKATIEDDPVKQSNERGYVSFAMAGPNSRTTQVFINFVDNSRLDQMGFAPFGKVRDESMKVVDELFSGYGEGAPRGKGPSQGMIQMQGNAYLKKEFPKLDYIENATIE